MENTNKTIALNTAILYVRLILITICGLFTTRFALKALGVLDFGLYMVLGGIVSLIAVVNSIMLVTSNRFIGVAIGKGDIRGANEQFNVNLFVHVSVAIITILLLLPLGRYYINHFVHYDGDIHLAQVVFLISVVGASISFIGVPYNGLLMSKENFLVFSVVDVISHIIKLLIALCLVFFFSHKLIIYALGMSLCSIYPTFVYYSYCNKHHKEYVKFSGMPPWNKIKDVLSFSLWSGYGAVASVAKNQGASLLVNAFFNTVLNAALGIATTIYNYVLLFAQNVTKPVSPQITKNYASGNYSRCENLLIFITKCAYLFMLIIATPFLLETEFILRLWLGQVPEYAVLFTRLLIIEALIDSLNNGISEVVFANGKIAFYQVTTNTAKLFALVIAFIFLKMGAPAASLLYSYIAISVIVFFLKQYSLRKVPGISQRRIVIQSYLPSLLITLLVLPVFIVKIPLHPLLLLCGVFFYELGLVFFIGLSKIERGLVYDFIFRGLNNVRKQN